MVILLQRAIEIVLLALALMSVEQDARADERADYVGIALCSECHKAQADSWKGSHHVLAMQKEIGIVVAFISGLGRVPDPWRELIAFVRSTSAAKVQFDLTEGTLGRRL